MEKFNTEPRDFALELVEEGLVSADHLLLCALKYMSHDDVRDMLNANELAPKECNNCETLVEDDEELCEDCQHKLNIEEHLDSHSVGYDTDMMAADIENGNHEVGDDAEEYLHENIVLASIENGKTKQAREQCDEYGLNYDEMIEMNQ